MSEAVCPADEVLAALVEGHLRGVELATLDAHLDACASCREVVATLASSPRPRGSRAARADIVGRFVVLGTLGEGAMGVVHAAYDPELDRKVALKVLHADRQDPRARARLVREAQAMARLSHPHVVTVYDVGTRGDEIYVAMELVEGESLRGWLQTPRAGEELLALFTRAGEGLAAAHDAGLVHRDFKPENVLVDASGSPKVGDFGLAVAGEGAPLEVSESALLGASITRTGALLGTPAYMAPEQLGGEPADARADQFAFCVALWEALTGSRPFEGARSITELRAAIEAGPPPARLPAALERALRRGLAPRRESRFEDLRALLAALRPRRGRPAWQAPLAVGLVAASAALIGLAMAERDPCASSAAAIESTLDAQARDGLESVTLAALDAWVAAWTGARVDACEATHVRHEQSEARLDRRMACLDRQRGALRAVLSRLRDPESAPFAIDAVESLPDPRACESGADTPPPELALRSRVDAARVRVDTARALLATAAHERALRASAGVVEEAAAIGYAPLESEARRLRADTLRALARYDEAEAEAEAAVLAAVAGRDDRAEVEGWLAALRVEGERGRYAAAARLARHAEAALVRAGDPDDLRGALLHARGILRTDLGELEQAELDLRDALERARRRHGEGSPRLAPLHTSLGNLFRVASRLDEALAEHERALVIDRGALGEAHPRVGRDLHNVGGILRRFGRTTEALDHYQRALEIAREALGAEHPSVGLTLNSLGLVARELGRHAEARARWEEALVILTAHGHGDEALVRVNLAMLALDEARFGDARASIERAIALDTARIGPRSKRTASEHVILARALAGEGRAADALASAERALDIALEIGDADLIAEARSLARAAPPAPRRAAAEPRGEIEPELPVAPAPPIVPQPVVRPPRATGSGAYGPARAWE